MTKSLPIITDKNKGIMYSFLSIIPYSIIPLIFLVQYSNLGGSGLGSDMAKGAVNVVGKDVISGFLFIILLIARNLKTGQRTFWRTFKSREGIYSGISGIFGGPIGYMLFNAAYYMDGSSFTHMFSAIEPIILVIYATLIWKRKFKWQVWLGVGLAVAGVIASIVGSTYSSSPWRAVVGSLLAIAGSCSWTVESILMDRAFTYSKKNKTSTLDLLAVKMIIAIAFNLIIMFPSMGAWDSSPANTFKAFGELFTNMDFLWRFILAGLLIMAGRAWFFSAVNYEGATISNVVYELTVIAMPIIALIWYGATGYYPGVENQSIGMEHLQWAWQVHFWCVATAIVAGAILVSVYPSKIDRIKEHKELKGRK